MTNNNPPQNYKNSEIGIIPQDWEVRILKDLSEKIMVGIASAATHAYRERGIVMFRNQNIKSNHLDDNDILHISEEYEQIFKGKRLKSGDLLTARTGYPGTTCIIPEKYENAQSFTTLITRPNTKAIESDYLCFYMNSEKGQAFFETNQIGGGQKNVNAGTLKTMPIPIPTKAEQTSIANALSDADALISSLEKLIEKKRNIKQGAMQKLLQPKEGWEVKKLGEIGEFKNGINKGAEDFGYGYPFVNLMDVFGIRKISNNLHLDLINSTEIDRKVYDLKQGDVLFIRSSVKPEGVGLTCLIERDIENTVFSGFIIRYRDYGTLSNEFKEYCFSTSYFRNRVIASSSVSANTNINQDSLKNLVLHYPKSKEEQTHIATILSDMDAEIEGLEAKLEKYRAIKLGMMQELLTGKTRLV
ncbi:restriction endonuclease subunit S [Emticicia sp. SJ17W-69]|uniref:restriction endonuclease subunit S n=1 Tax=Emticicia sp. SJ17W-69 TaxID=3421657 RepID=UPI003EBF12D6